MVVLHLCHTIELKSQLRRPWSGRRVSGSWLRQPAPLPTPVVAGGCDWRAQCWAVDDRMELQTVVEV